MTNGKLVTKDGSNVLNVIDVYGVTTAGTDYWRAIVKGEKDWNYERPFLKSDWEFIPDKPSVLEQVQAFPVGTKFKYSDGGLHYLKFTSGMVVYWNPAWPDSDGATLTIQGAFNGVGTGILEVIE